MKFRINAITYDSIGEMVITTRTCTSETLLNIIESIMTVEPATRIEIHLIG